MRSHNELDYDPAQTYEIKIYDFPGLIAKRFDFIYFSKILPNPFKKVFNKYLVPVYRNYLKRTEDKLKLEKSDYEEISKKINKRIGELEKGLQGIEQKRETIEKHFQD